MILGMLAPKQQGTECKMKRHTNIAVLMAFFDRVLAL